MWSVKVPVPLVRPLVRWSLRRALRFLPSVLLLVFVLSLIFVTLLQIAVIHAHRRAFYTQRQQQQQQQASPVAAVTTTSPAPDDVSATSRPAAPVSKPVSHKKPDSVRVEALLDQNAPSVDHNGLVLQGMINVARLRQLLKSLGAKVPNDTAGQDNAASLSRTGRQALASDSTTVGNFTWVSLWAPEPSPSAGSVAQKSLCPAVPPGLAGRLKMNFNIKYHNDMEDISRENPEVLPGGVWAPANCSSRHRVAVIIPYRDREYHLAILLRHLHPILQRQLLDYRVYVVEQNGNYTFNKGVLMNAGVKEALKDYDFHCFVFHDVDMIPEDDRNMYSCPPSPRHMSVAVDKFNYTLPYNLLIGGVFAIRSEQYVQANGYSNLYWGWGGEDDDMAYRIQYKKMNIIRPPESVARYTMIKHSHRAESPYNIRLALLRLAKRRAGRDGLNSVRYKVVKREDHRMYTNILVDISHNHRWRFVQGKGLVVNL